MPSAKWKIGDEVAFQLGATSRMSGAVVNMHPPLVTTRGWSYDIEVSTCSDPITFIYIEERRIERADGSC